MRCADFQMTVTIVAGGPSFRILDQTAEDTVASRREAKEQETVAAENATAVTPETTGIIGDRLTKTYYTAGCQPAKITEVNRVTFKSTNDAEKAGFKAARNCH